MPSTKTKKKVRSRSAIGRQARAFGHEFERAIVHEFKEHFKDEPWAESVRRSDQSHRAWLPDVTGVPGLWPECQVAQNIQPEVKLKQALRDTARFKSQNKIVCPVAITRRKGQQTINVTVRAHDLGLMILSAAGDPEARDAAVSMSLDAFLELYAAYLRFADGMLTRRMIDTEKMRLGVEDVVPEPVRTKKAPPLATGDIARAMGNAVKKPKKAPRPVPDDEGEAPL